MVNRSEEESVGDAEVMMCGRESREHSKALCGLCRHHRPIVETACMKEREYSARIETLSSADNGRYSSLHKIMRTPSADRDTSIGV